MDGVCVWVNVYHTTISRNDSNKCECVLKVKVDMMMTVK